MKEGESREGGGVTLQRNTPEGGGVETNRGRGCGEDQKKKGCNTLKVEGNEQGSHLHQARKSIRVKKPQKEDETGLPQRQ